MVDRESVMLASSSCFDCAVFGLVQVGRESLAQYLRQVALFLEGSPIDLVPEHRLRE